MGLLEASFHILSYKASLAHLRYYASCCSVYFQVHTRTHVSCVLRAFSGLSYLYYFSSYILICVLFYVFFFFKPAFIFLSQGAFFDCVLILTSFAFHVDSAYIHSLHHTLALVSLCKVGKGKTNTLSKLLPVDFPPLVSVSLGSPLSPHIFSLPPFGVSERGQCLCVMG